MNKRYRNILKITYDKSTATIKSDIGTSRHQQSDILSALVFCIVIATVILHAEAECNSRYSISGNLISNLSYPDDTAAISRSSKELKQFLNCLVKYLDEVGLFVNVSETE